jgi:protein required for attachment to host cells
MPPQPWGPKRSIGEPPQLLQELVAPQATSRPGEPSGEPMQRFARRVADLLEQAYAQARFEFLRIAVEPRFQDSLRAEIDRRLDLHRAVLEWRALGVIPPKPPPWRKPRS